MATRDRRANVLQTLTHLTALPERPPVVLVDNGSSDGTVEVVTAQFPEVRILRLGRNLGAAARTAGVEAASTPYVAFADDDSWWAPGSLSRAAELFDDHPRLGLLAARILVGPAQRPDPVCALLAESPLGRPDDLPGRAILGFVACGAVVRRSAYLAVGGFSPVVFFFGEETLLAQDLAAAGWGCAYVPELVAFHVPASAGPRRGRVRLGLRNALLSTWLRRPLGVCLRDTGRLLRRAPDPDVRGALADAVRRLPQVARHRRALPDHVEAQVRLLERA